ncbi:MAG TPA: ABC transporter substrate-binding protein [Thermomicrobiales bacterium]|nr:ABC transporter substrate-binding protein [Thermomicrobiales bacterium]
MAISRRTILKGAAGTAAAGALAISPKASRTFAAPAVISRQGSNTEINFWYGFTGNLGEQVQALIDAFNAQNNGVQVIGTAQASYEETAQQATIAVQDGSNPDLAILSDVWWFRFYLAQLLLPMDDLISSTSFQIDDVVDSFRYEGVRQGVQYWLPFARSTPVVYWNTDIFGAAGVTEFPTTWSEFEAIAPSLVDESQQIGALALGPAADYLAWPFQGIAWAYGGAYSDPDFTIRIDEEGAVNAGNLFLRGVQEGWAYTAEVVNDEIANGYAAMVLSSTGSLRGITTAAEANGVNFRTAFLPGELPGAEPHCSTGGSGFGIMSNIPVERQQAAFEFVRFCSAYEQAISWSQNTGYMPILKSGIAGPEMAEFFAANPNFKTAVDQLPFTKAQDAARAFIPGGDQIIGQGIAEIVVNQTDPAEAFAAVAERLTAEAQPVIEQVMALEGDLTSGAATPSAGTPSAGTPSAGTPAATPAS